jgi:hypothetical protein
LSRELENIRHSLFFVADLARFYKDSAKLRFEKNLSFGEKEIKLTVFQYSINGNLTYNLVMTTDNEEVTAIQPFVMISQQEFIEYCKLRNIDLLNGWKLVHKKD